MNSSESIRPRLDRLQQRALVIGGAALVLCVLGAFVFGDLEQFFRSYLLGFILWLGISLGSFGLLMLHNLVGGPWGYVIRRVLEASIKTLPVLAILFIPLLFGLHDLYHWAHEEVVATDAILQHKSVYLNVPFFIGRSALYFVIWISIGFFITRAMRRLEDEGGSVVSRRVQTYSAFGIVLYFLTATFASFDWMMSLEPHWFSTVYGMLFIVGQVLTTFAFTIVVMLMLARVDNEVGEAMKPGYRHDLGNFLFAFTMFWAYISISQYLIIWSANLPEETPWYLNRITGGWEWIPILLLLFHFFAPFMMLLSVKLKRSPTALMRVAMLIFVMRLVDTFWLIEPSFQHGDHVGFHFHWLDLVAPIGIGGIWVAGFIRVLKGSSLLPLNIAVPKEELQHG